MGEIEKYTLIVDRELFRKFRYISDWEGRSANKELAVIVRRYIVIFESRHARLNFDTEREHMNQKHTLRKSLCVFCCETNITGNAGGSKKISLYQMLFIRAKRGIKLYGILKAYLIFLWNSRTSH